MSLCPLQYSNSSPATVKELFVVHKLGLVSLPFPTVTSSVLKQSDAIKLLFCILTTKDEGPGTGAQLDLDRWVHNAQHSHKTFEKLQSYFPSHDSGRQKVVDVRTSSLCSSLYPMCV